MKKRTLFLAVLAVVLVLSSGIGTALAYFSTYADARGGYVIRLQGRTEIEEEITAGRKTVVIRNLGETATDVGHSPAFVRVSAVADSLGRLDYSKNTSALWQQNGNYWYYLQPIMTGEETEAFIIDVKLNRELKEGEKLDVIVSYDSVPAVFKENGDPDPDTAWANASNIIYLGSDTVSVP